MMSMKDAVMLRCHVVRIAGADTDLIWGGHKLCPMQLPWQRTAAEFNMDHPSLIVVCCSA